MASACPPNASACGRCPTPTSAPAASRLQALVGDGAGYGLSLGGGVFRLPVLPRLGQRPRDLGQGTHLPLRSAIERAVTSACRSCPTRASAPATLASALSWKEYRGVMERAIVLCGEVLRLPLLLRSGQRSCDLGQGLRLKVQVGARGRQGLCADQLAEGGPDRGQPNGDLGELAPGIATPAQTGGFRESRRRCPAPAPGSVQCAPCLAKAQLPGQERAGTAAVPGRRARSARSLSGRALCRR